MSQYENPLERITMQQDQSKFAHQNSRSLSVEEQIFEVEQIAER